MAFDMPQAQLRCSLVSFASKQMRNFYSELTCKNSHYILCNALQGGHSLSLHFVANKGPNPESFHAHESTLKSKNKDFLCLPNMRKAKMPLDSVCKGVVCSNMLSNPHRCTELGLESCAPRENWGHVHFWSGPVGPLGPLGP